MRQARVRELREIVVAPTGRRFAIIGDATDFAPPSGARSTTYHFLEPHVIVVEVCSGRQYSVATAQVARWRREA